MTNKPFISAFKMMTALLELHGANTFKIRAYANVIYQIENLDFLLSEASESQLQEAKFKKGMIEKIQLLKETYTFPELEELHQKTPKDVIKMLQIKGIGAKKVRQLWQELNVQTLAELREAGEKGNIEKLKGFGKKTQETILKEIVFLEEIEGWFRYADIESYVEFLEKHLRDSGLSEQIEVTGQFRRNLEIINLVQVLIETTDFEVVRTYLNQCEKIAYDVKNSGVFVWRGKFVENDLRIEIKGVSNGKFYGELLLNSAHLNHLKYRTKMNQTLLQTAKKQNFKSENEIYESIGLSFIPPELREGTFEFEKAEKSTLPTLLEISDLKGILHNHSKYSDGANSLEKMAIACRDLGFEYLGISDHSKTAFYANGLTEDRIQKQHEEIEKLNKELAPFRIFKGIESDILSDGNLDYSKEVLQSFDFIVASIHSGLQMDEKKATQRILTAIQNPYTTILGHPTGRLLLRRRGYPLDYQVIFEACVKHQVVIEINANPRRLDLDWRLVHQALEQGVMLSVNPDAHHKSQYEFMKYGVLVGRKGGLTKDKTLNAMNLEEITTYFEKRKQAIL